MTEPEHARCPGCDGTDLSIDGHDKGDIGSGVYAVVCNYCGWRGPQSYRIEDVWTKWDRRPTPSPSAGAVAEGWREMDDVPRDGTFVDLLLSSGREVKCAYWGADPVDEQAEGWMVADKWVRGEDEEAIRWRPFRSPLRAASPKPEGE